MEFNERGREGSREANERGLEDERSRGPEGTREAGVSWQVGKLTGGQGIHGPAGRWSLPGAVCARSEAARAARGAAPTWGQWVRFRGWASGREGCGGAWGRPRIEGWGNPIDKTLARLRLVRFRRSFLPVGMLALVPRPHSPPRVATRGVFFGGGRQWGQAPPSMREMKPDPMPAASFRAVDFIPKSNKHGDT